jgi:GNAT superfamily N-acetyltransferase
VDLRPTAFDDTDATKLIEEVQQEYAARYGTPDESPIDPAEFAPPQGFFLVGYDEGEPVACGGWRVYEEPPAGLRHGDAEIKRMFVVKSARGKGFARAMLAEVERTAAAAGHRRMVLETGIRQPEAIALYRSAGYTDIPGFGYYAEDELSVHLAKDLSAD